MSGFAAPYPKPGPIGGRVIREMISFMRKQGASLPLTSHILIAISGGSDSMALAHLLTHFGRRIIDRQKLTLLHVNHGWRGQESDLDEQFVQKVGDRWGVPVIIRRLNPPKLSSGVSWEEEARCARKKIFNLLAQQYQAIVLTAHQADDLAETVLWRLFTGAAQTHGGGVAFSYGVEMRPLLTVRKVLLMQYLKEVQESFREDATNCSDRFLRARMRSRLMPEVERLFPRAIEHLGSLALMAQKEATQSKIESSDQLSSLEAAETLIHATGIKARRSHRELIMEKLVANEPWYGEIHLPGGWKLIREKRKAKSKSTSIRRIQLKRHSSFDRWILERI